MEVYNFGAASSGSGQGLARILYEVVDLDPNLIIMYNGANDFEHPFFGDPVQIRGVVNSATITANRLGCVIVGHDKDNIWLFFHTATFYLFFHKKFFNAAH